MNRALPKPMPAPCRQSPDDWFPDGTIGQGAKREMEYAASVCRALCTIRANCLTLAMRCEDGQPAASRHGVFGGLTPSQRAALDPKVAKPLKARQQALAA